MAQKQLTVNFSDGVVVLSAITSADYITMRRKDTMLGVGKPLPWHTLRKILVEEGLSNFLNKPIIGGLCLKIIKINVGTMYHFYPLSELATLLTKLGRTPKDFK